jgi:hypothetical protein
MCYYLGIQRKRRLKVDDEKKVTMTVEEAARLLGVCRNTGYEAVRFGQIPSVKIWQALPDPGGGDGAAVEGGGVNWTPHHRNTLCAESSRA